MTTGARFIKWGLGLFIFGVFLSFGPIGHYVVGANHPTGEAFLHNISLWFACPWTMAVAVIQLGGLGMVALGLTRLQTARLSTSPKNSEESPALLLCIVGLLGMFAVGYAGYFVFDAVWPSFYYMPIAAGKNAWRLSQALCIAIYLVGVVMMFNAERHALNTISNT
jgi:hypothetical protein